MAQWEQPETRLVVWIRLWITHRSVNRMADISCFSARVKEDFWVITGLQEWGQQNHLC